MYIIHHVSFLSVYILKKLWRKLIFLFFSSRISSPLSRLLFSFFKKNLTVLLWLGVLPGASFMALMWHWEGLLKMASAPPSSLEHFNTVQIFFFNSNSLRFYLYFWTFRHFEWNFQRAAQKIISVFLFVIFALSLYRRPSPSRVSLVKISQTQNKEAKEEYVPPLGKESCLLSWEDEP